MRALRAFLACVAVFPNACGARTPLDVAGVPDATSVPSCAPKEFTVVVTSEAPWSDTNIDVPAGTRLTMTATGSVSYFGAHEKVTGPDGGNFDGQKFFATAALPGAVIVSLIGKIGGSVALDTGTPLPEGTTGDGNGFVGSDYDRIVPVAGRLFLGFNDQTDAFGDNSGSFTVKITTGC